VTPRKTDAVRSIASKTPWMTKKTLIPAQDAAHLHAVSLPRAPFGKVLPGCRWHLPRVIPTRGLSQHKLESPLGNNVSLNLCLHYPLLVLYRTCDIWFLTSIIGFLFLENPTNVSCNMCFIISLFTLVRTLTHLPFFHGRPVINTAHFI
jgi:hypothetical protein